MTLILKSFGLIYAIVLSNFLLPSSLAQEEGLNIRTGNKLYYIELSEEANFFRAAHACAALGMKLANLETDSDVKRIKTTLLLNDIDGNAYWLSGTTYGNSAAFIDFFTGSKIKFIPSELTPAASQGCLYTEASTFVYKSSTDCATDVKYFICEKPLVPYCGKYGQCRYRYY